MPGKHQEFLSGLIYFIGTGIIVLLSIQPFLIKYCFEIFYFLHLTIAIFILAMSIYHPASY